MVEPWARHTPSSSTDEIRRVGGSLPATTNRGVLACPSRNDSRHTNDCRPAHSRAGCARARITRGASSSRWLAITAGLIVLVATVGGGLKDQFEIPGSDAQKATDLIESQFASEQGSVLNLVFAAPEGQRLDTPERKAAIAKAIAAPEVERVQGDPGPGRDRRASATRSARTRSRTAAGSHTRRPSSTA